MAPSQRRSSEAEPGFASTSLGGRCLFARDPVHVEADGTEWKGPEGHCPVRLAINAGSKAWPLRFPAAAIRQPREDPTSFNFRCWWKGERGVGNRRLLGPAVFAELESPGNTWFVRILEWANFSCGQRCIVHYPNVLVPLPFRLQRGRKRKLTGIFHGWSVAASQPVIMIRAPSAGARPSLPAFGHSPSGRPRLIPTSAHALALARWSFLFVR